jgi:DNA-binding GntR family transcriptional regulator
VSEPISTTLTLAPIGRIAAPLRTQVLDALREAILSTQFAPGQRLIERELIDMTGVSRTTIREVLRELAAEGLVETVPQKGAVVVSLGAEEVEELYEIREVLEGHLVKRFVEQASDADVRALREAMTALDDHVAQGADTAALVAAKDRLYEVLLDGAGNATLRSSLSRLHARVSFLRASSMSSGPDRPAQAAAELRRLVEAVEARDADGAVEAVVTHVRAAARVGIETVRGIEQRAAQRR